VLFQFGATFLICLQRFADTIEQLLISERFLNKVDRTFLHGLYGHGHVAVTRNEDNRQGTPHFNQFVLKLQPPKPWHANVQHQAARFLMGKLFQEIVRGMIDLVVESNRPHQQFHRMANRLVIIDDENRRVLFRVVIHDAYPQTLAKSVVSAGVSSFSVVGYRQMGV